MLSRASHPARAFATPNWLLWGSVGLGCLAAASARAQDALRQSLAGEQAAEARKQAIDNIPAFLQWGDAKFALDAKMDIELNDSINLTDVGRQEDLILRPGFSFMSAVPLSEVNTFYLGLDAAYAKYIQHPEYDRILLAPGSEFGFDVYTSGFHINFHNRISYTENPIAQGQLSGVADFGEFSNTAGFSVDYDLQNVTFTLGYDHAIVLSATSRFSYLNNNSDSLVARMTLRPDLPVSYGLEASTGWTYYQQDLLSPSQSYSFGGFADWKPTDYLHIVPRAGYVTYLFGMSASPPVANQRGYYLSVDLQHRTNRIFSYDVEAGHQVQLGVYSDLVELWYARPNLAVNFIRDVPITVHATYENGTDTGNTVLVINERYSRLEFGASASYQFGKSSSVRLEYDHVIRDSNIPIREYHQNRVLLDFIYQF